MMSGMNKKDKTTSADSIAEANRSRVKFSGHGRALGAAGHREASDDPDNCEYLRQPGQSIAINPSEAGFESITVGVSWNNVATAKAGLFGKLVGAATGKGVDLDIGCLYELEDGTRGALQAFGEKFGSFDGPPYIQLSGDERTGNKAGQDEFIKINPAHWTKIKRLVIYLYIYDGAPSWAAINPQIILDVPGENDLAVTLDVHNDQLPICAVGGLEQVRGGIRLINYTEYFPGHQEMDRAFGFGLPWDDGKK